MSEKEELSEQSPNEVLNDIKVGGENKTAGFLSFFFDLIKTFIIVMIIAFVIRYFVIQPFVVDGDSMLPTFVNNEYLIAEKISYDFHQPRRGDVVIFRYPKNPSVIYIKRIIGLPGENIKIIDGKVEVADHGSDQYNIIDENYLSLGAKTETNLVENDQPGSGFKIALQENEFFVLGDNRDHSSDSREWGVLPRANIIGRVWLTVTPLDKLNFWGVHKYITEEAK